MIDKKELTRLFVENIQRTLLECFGTPLSKRFIKHCYREAIVYFLDDFEQQQKELINGTGSAEVPRGIFL